MDFILKFDDELFSETSCKEIKSDSKAENLKYKPKICNPEWFNSPDIIDESDIEKSVPALKFRADFSYANKKFQEALEVYESILPLVETNVKLKKDCEEGRIRCLMRLGSPSKALNGILTMISSSQSPADLYNSLTLLAQIYHELQDISGEIWVLQELLNADNLNGISWFQLAHAYLCQWKISQSSNEIVPDMDSMYKPNDCLFIHALEEQIHSDDLEVKKLWEKEKTYWFMGASFLRTRVLMQTVENHSHYLNYKKHKAILTEIEQILTLLHLPDSFVEEALKAFYQDLTGEGDVHIADDFETTNSVSIRKNLLFDKEKINKAFELRWFNWIIPEFFKDENM